MTAESIITAPDRELLFDQIADELELRGYAVLPVALPAELAEQLLLRVIELGDGAFKPGGVGRQSDYQQNRLVRSDEIRWFTAEDAAEAAYLEWMNALREGMNRRLFLGLFDYECHFARYAPGSFYRKHVDAFRGRSNRVLSTVYYLNPGWTAADGGQLLIYGDRDELTDSVIPLMGTLGVFLSEKVPHEVSAAKRLRHSIAGWFRVNTSLGPHIDPPA